MVFRKIQEPCFCTPDACELAILAATIDTHGVDERPAVHIQKDTPKFRQTSALFPTLPTLDALLSTAFLRCVSLPLFHIFLSLILAATAVAAATALLLPVAPPLAPAVISAPAAAVLAVLTFFLFLSFRRRTALLLLPPPLF